MKILQTVSFVLTTIVLSSIGERLLIIRKPPYPVGNPYSTTCNTLEYNLPYEEYHISDSSLIDRIYSSLSKTQAKDSIPTGFQIAYKLLFIDSGKVRSIVCLDSTTIVHDGIVKQSSSNMIHNVECLLNNRDKEKTQLFLPDRLGEEATIGRDSLIILLNKTLNNLDISYNGKVNLAIYCWADRYGKTKGVKVEVFALNMNNVDKERIKISTENLINASVQWKVDPMRMKNDIIIIPCRVDIANK